MLKLTLNIFILASLLLYYDKNIKVKNIAQSSIKFDSLGLWHLG